MKRHISVVLIVIILVFAVMAVFPDTASAAGTTLFAGDIVFVGLNSDGDDEFAMLLLRDIAAGYVVLYHRQRVGWFGIL